MTQKLSYSRGLREASDIDSIKRLIPGCISVVKTDDKTDKTGVDYIATLRKGAEILIDAKTREPNASRWWSDGPELALETWSVMPGGLYNTPIDRAKVGWTLCETKPTDMVYYTFDPADSTDIFLIPFQHLRMAIRVNWADWSKLYPVKTQQSFSWGTRWESQCIFVPADVVLKAIDAVMRCQVQGI